MEDVPCTAHLQHWACFLNPARLGVWAATMEMFRRGNDALRHQSCASAFGAGLAVFALVILRAALLLPAAEVLPTMIAREVRENH